ncbi:MAG: hypothetical protein D6722_22905 [Bacteroidetes bacterium]|nr:MAG: hypothetical protein D6722_22905 [Bacteroidota bacterium]
MKDLAHTPPTVELLLDYLEGRLSADEARWVSQQVESEPFYQEALQGLKQALAEDPDHARSRAQRYRDLMRQRFQEGASAASASTNWWQARGWQIAAAILLLLLPALYFLQRPPLEERLAQQHLRPYQASSLRGGTEASTAETYIAALLAYQQEAYADAIAQFETFLAHPEAAEGLRQPAQLHLGISYLLNGQAREAVDPLSRVLGQNDPRYNDDARWYLAWAYLQSDRDTEALELFSLLAQKPNPHREAAQEVWEALRADG